MNNSTKPNLKVLIVDDDPDDHYLYKRLLSEDKPLQCTFLQSETGQEGFELCRTQQPDCILLDYILPDIDGLEFLTKVKSLPRKPVVIMLTGQGDETVAVLAMKEGAGNYLVKSHLTANSLKKALLDAVSTNGHEDTPWDARQDPNGERSNAMFQEIQILRKKLESAPGIDPVTRLPNRANMVEKIHHEKFRFERSHKPFSLIMADIDDFQSIQDILSSEATNHILAQIGRMLDTNSRKQDIVGRWGGGRFVLILPETDLNGAAVVLEKFCRLVELIKFDYQDRETLLTMSFKAGVYDDATVEIEQCIRLADEYLL